MRICSDEDLVHAARADLVCFSLWPLRFKPWKCQRMWQELIQSEYTTKPEERKHLIMLAPSEHGKTTAMGIPLALWLLSRDSALRIIVAGSKDNIAAQLGYGIDKRLNKFPQDFAKLGIVKSFPWSIYEKYLERENDESLIHPSLQFIGPNSEAQGQRADVIICTDLCTIKNSRTPETRRQMRDWFDQTLMPRLEPNGWIFMEGHHVHNEDLYADLEDDPDFRVVKFSAITREPSETNKPEVLAPERWTYKLLDQRRRQRPGVFQLIYQNKKVATSGFITRETMELCLDHARPMLSSIPEDVRRAYDKIVMSMDPAWSVKKWAKYSVLGVAGIPRDNPRKRDWLFFWRDRLTSKALKDKMKLTLTLIKPDYCFIEANAAQVFFVDQLIEEVKKESGEQLAAKVRHVWTAESNDWTMEKGFSEVVERFIAVEMTLPYGDEAGRVASEQFITEVEQFPGKYTDTVMQAVVMEKGLSEIAKSDRTCYQTRGITRSVAQLGRQHARFGGSAGIFGVRRPGM